MYVLHALETAAHLINAQLELIPGYVIWTDLQYLPSQQQILAVTALDQFTNDWQPLSEACLAARLKSGDPLTPTTVHQRLEYKNCSLGARSAAVHLTVNPSALHLGAYNISVQAGEISEPPKKIGNHRSTRNQRLPPVVHSALLLYRFTPAQACELRLVSAQRVLHTVFSHTTQMSCPRATAQWWSDGSVIVSYHQREVRICDHFSACDIDMHVSVAFAGPCHMSFSNESVAQLSLRVTIRYQSRLVVPCHSPARFGHL